LADFLGAFFYVLDHTAHCRMRSLTEAEARVIRGLLADLPGPERLQVREAGVPRTTYQVVRHRVFTNGWLKERYIPHPFLLGTKRIRFILAQPYAERWNDSVRALRSMEDIVVMWASPETLFGVVFERSPSRDWDGLRSPQSFRRYWTVAPGVQGDGLLAYFDYEGVWSRWTLGSEPIAYPRSLPNSAPAVHAASHEDWAALRALVVRPFDSGLIRAGFMTFSPARLSNHERRLLADGRVSHRVLPDFSDIPPVRGYRPERLVFVTGEIQPGKNPRTLFGNLVQHARVAPFLYVYDDDRVLLSALSPAPVCIANERASVIAVLQEHLQKIEVVREPIDSLFPVIDHRYDRLAIPAGT
jgi:hypothetical protein